MASQEPIVATGRVISVTCGSDGRFHVILGPVPHVTTYSCEADPPELGAQVTVQASRSATRPLPPGSLRVLSEDAKQTVHRDVAPERAVPSALVKRVSGAMRRPLLSYQRIGAAWMAQRILDGKGAILADDPGLGKTTQTVATVCALNLFPCVIVCPSSLRLNWPREFKHSLANPRTTQIEGREGKFQAADVYVMNYGVLRAREHDIGALRPACIVFDEAHELKEVRAGPKHRAAVGTRLANYVRSVIALTGTPLLNHPREFWRILNMVDPEEWPSFDKFDLRYLRPPTDGKMTQKRIVTDRGRAENVDELRVKTQSAMLRRTKQEVAQDLPPKRIESILVQLDPADQAAYDEAETDVIAWLHKIGESRRAESASRTIALAKLSMLRRIAAVGKLRRAVPMFLQTWFSAPRRSPLVVFAYHRVVLQRVYDIAKALGIRAVGIAGGSSVSSRQDAVDAFQKGKADLFVCPIRAGGVGINLQRAADSLFLERSWSPSLQVQAEDRVHRLGQVRPVTITYLDARGTVDEHVASVVAQKKHLIDRLVDGDPEQDETHDTGTVAAGIIDRLAAKPLIIPAVTSNG